MIQGGFASTVPTPTVLLCLVLALTVPPSTALAFAVLPKGGLSQRFNILLDLLEIHID